MSTVKNLIAGLGGAIALNILHESLKKQDFDMPRIDLLGEEALQKVLGYFGKEIYDEDKLYLATLASDVVSNAFYYSLIGAVKQKHVWTAAVGLGIAAGVGAIILPKPMGLDPAPVTKTQKTKALTIAYYLTGAVVTGCVIKSLSKQGA